MGFAVTSAFAALLLFVALILLFEVGRRIRRWRVARDGEHDAGAFGIIDGAIFALLGLLIAFTFSGAASRFQSRREHVVHEANAIGTAYLRIDLVPAAAQPGLRQQFRDYVDSRLAIYRALPDFDAAFKELARSGELQQQIWAAAIAASRDEPQAKMLLLPALNEMIDITTTRTVEATILHPPVTIFVLLILLCLLCAAIGGYGAGATRSWLHAIGFAAILTATVYITWNLEYPRLGFIRIDPIDQLLVDVRTSFK